MCYRCTFQWGRYFKKHNTEDKSVFNDISKAEWNLAREMEGIVHTMAEFSLGEVQKEAVSASFATLLFRRATKNFEDKSITCYSRAHPTQFA